MPAPGRTVTREILALLALAWPLIGNNLAIAGMSFADAVMAGRLSGGDLAAVAVGNSVWMLFFFSALGVLMAISPLVSRCHGAGDIEKIGAYVRQGFVVAAGMATFVLVSLQLVTGPLLTAIGIDPEFRDLAAGYTRAISWGAPAICAYLVLRYLSEGVGWTKPILYASLFALVVNVAGNYVFMYGYLGAPALGAVGCGVASAVAMWAMLFALLVYVYKSRRYAKYRIFERIGESFGKLRREIVSLGVPIAANLCAEAGLFAAVSLLMGTLSANAAAAHQIAINYVATMFMVPLAIASATTVRVGHALGEQDPVTARRRGFQGVALCGAFMTFSALTLLIFKDQIVGIYTTDPAVGSIAVSLLFVAAIFQISDGVQVGVSGALRGFKDTRVPLLLNLTAYWIIGFPLAYGAARNSTLGPQLVWTGFVVGLSVAAILLLTRYFLLTRRYIN